MERKAEIDITDTEKEKQTDRLESLIQWGCGLQQTHGGREAPQLLVSAVLTQLTCTLRFGEIPLHSPNKPRFTYAHGGASPCP